MVIEQQGRAGARPGTGPLARPGPIAVRRVVDEHADRLYGLFRLVLADRGQAEEALAETFEAALREWDSRPRDEERIGAWLIALSAGALQRRLLPTSLPLSDLPPSAPISAEILATIPDSTLAVMVRALPPRSRRAVALVCVLGIAPEHVAVMLDCQAADIADDLRSGLGELTERLRPELVAEEPFTVKGTLARKPAPHLAPIPKVPTGPVRIRNGRIYRERTDGGFMERILRAISRTFRRLRRRVGLGPLDDTAGTAGLRTSAPEPTPTMRPIERPRETPTIGRRDRPEATPGMASYQTPRGTPSTRRLSNPRHPGQAASGRSGLGAAGRPRGY